MKLFTSKALYRLLKKERKEIDAMMWFAGFAAPLATMPQIISVFSSKSANDISLITWVFYLIFAVIMFLYAVLHKIKPMIYGQLVWITVDILLIVGIVMYS